MIFFVAAFALALHILFWGVGLALLVTPTAWKKWWPVFVAPAGLALQSAVVWGGAYSNLAGTNVYALWTEIVPFILLVAGVWYRRGRFVNDLARFRSLAVVMGGCLIFLIAPMSQASRTLTTMSLGSCDAADYAAGARVLQEFSRADRSGFIGLSEVVQVASVDNFYDFWLRLNHFTPSALIAFNGAALGWKHYEIISVLTAVLVVLTIPAVFWLARHVVRLPGSLSIWIAMIYGLSPVTWYAVAHVAMGQLLAAQAIAVLLAAAFFLWKSRFSWRRSWEMAGLLFIVYWLILGSYNFIIVVAFVPVVMFTGIQTLMQGTWGKFARWLACLLAPLLICGVVFAQRSLGLIERFLLFQKTDFGWRIPALSPEGWLGWVKGAGLEPVGFPWRIAVTIALGVLLVVAACRQGLVRRWSTFTALSLAVPILIGYGYLEWRGLKLGTNASYDAYKLFAVFYPGLLVAFCYWVVLLESRWRPLRWAAGLAILLVTAANLNTAYRFSLRMERPPLMVGKELTDLQRIESMPQVGSINMLIPEFWARLWANAFLLRKPQYFAEHTYEGRINTVLRGEWALTDGFISARLPEHGDSVRVSQGFNLVDQRSPEYIYASLGAGWYGGEFSNRPFSRWHWSKGDGRVLIENPHGYPLRVSAELMVRGVGERQLELWRDGIKLQSTRLTPMMRPVHFSAFVLPPGTSTIEFRTNSPPESPGPLDSRQVDFALYGIRLDVKRANDIPL